MPILTIKAIREEPWNVMTHTLPAQPRRLLLEAAYLAADYCRSIEYLFMAETRDADFTPDGWQVSHPDGPDESESRGQRAHRRVLEICECYEREFGEKLD
jgi:hypothetical protein